MVAQVQYRVLREVRYPTGGLVLLLAPPQRRAARRFHNGTCENRDRRSFKIDSSPNRILSSSLKGRAHLLYYHTYVDVTAAQRKRAPTNEPNVVTPRFSDCLSR